MDFNRIKLYYHTIRFLRFKQIYYRVFYFFRNKLVNYKISLNPIYDINDLTIVREVMNPISFHSENKFTFLNKSYLFSKEIQWNFLDHGKLWAYNLNYFDFLNQNNLDPKKGKKVIYDFIAKETSIKVGKEAYPISLRGINWIKFLTCHKINDKKINDILYNHYSLLIKNLEYHLLGNHLLENGFSLLFGAYYFKNKKFYKKAKKIISYELKEQTLDDGAHFELSSMYHQIILFRLLECVSLLKNNNWKNDISFKEFLKDKAVMMLSYLKTITYNNGDIPMVNDSAYGIAPSSEELFDCADSLGLEYDTIELGASGYRKFKNERYELFIDVGEVGPKYQAGHAHADMLNFELYNNNKPFIVDTGTSTYENNVLRQRERSTESHNTVVINSTNQSQVWGGFRVASRAKIIKKETLNNKTTATHDGYKKIAGLHNREFHPEERKIVIKDVLLKGNNTIESIANFHFYSDITICSINENSVELNNGAKIVFESSNVLLLTKNKYQLAAGFNKTIEAEKLSVRFNNNLTTHIEL